MKSSRFTMRIIVWVAFIVLTGWLAAVCLTQRKTVATLREQLQVQQTQLQELDRLREENKAAQQLKDQQAELERLRENSNELLRLRNEMRQLREQLAELETLRAANAELLRVVQSTPNLQSNQLAMISAARRRGAILGITVRPSGGPAGAPAGGASGAIVAGIDANSPVAQSGLKVGDLIYGLDGRAITNSAQLQTEMLTRKPGETVVVDVLRDNAPLRFNVQTRAWPQ